MENKKVKIVVITSRFPFPVEKGDKLRIFHQLQGLARKHEIHLIAISHEHVDSEYIEELRKYCVDIQVFNITKLKLYYNILAGALKGLPIQISYFLDRSVKSRIQSEILRIEPDHIYAQLIRTTEYVRTLPFPKTLDYMDVFSEGMNQKIASSNIFSRWVFRRESLKLAEYEKAVYRDFDHHIMISEQDRQRLKIPYTKNIRIIPNGVDVDFFQHKQSKKVYDIAFVGNMGYPPNVEAAIFLCQKILPLVKSEFPNVRILIAGARPDIKVTRLQSKNVSVSGWLDDIRLAYDQSRVFVAPIFSGIGQQNKILEAMSMSVPSVTTQMVNNAIGATDQLDICLAEKPSDFAKQIIRLLTDPELYKKMKNAGRRFVETNYLWDRQNQKLNNLISGTEVNWEKRFQPSSL